MITRSLIKALGQLTKIDRGLVMRDGVLPHVVIWLGQSESEHAFRREVAFNQNVPAPTISKENLTVVMQPNSEGVNPLEPAEVVRVTQANVDAGTVSRSMGLVSMYLARVAPNQEFIILDAVHDGSGRDELVDDADTNRKWEDFTSILSEATAQGWTINSVIEWWYSKDIASIPQFHINYAPHYLGILEDSSPFTLGSVHTAGSDGATVNHIFWDALSAPDDPGRGVLTKADTSHMIVRPMPFQGIPVAPDELRNFTVTSAGAAHSGNSRRIDDAIQAGDIEAFRQLMVTHGVDSVNGPGTHNILFGGPTGTGHPNVDSPHGLPQVAYMMAISIAARAGKLVLPDPQIVGYTYDEANPQRLIVDVSIPAGGTLTTARLKNSIAAPVTPSPHQQQVVGFEVARSTDTEDQRRPIFLSTEVTYPSAYRGSVTLLSGSTTDGQGNPIGQIQIDMDEDWNNGDVLYFGRGSSNGLLQLPRDLDNLVQLDLPVVDIPAWESPSLPVPWNGLPVNRLITPLTVAGVPAPSGPTALQFATKTEGTNTAITGPNVPANVSSITVAIESSIPLAVTNSIDEFFEIQQETLRIDVDPRVGNMRIRQYSEFADGVRTVNGTLGTKDIIPADTWTEMVLSTDNVTGMARAWLDGTQMLDSPFTGRNDGTQYFATNQPITLGSASTMGFSIRRVRIWFNQTTTDGSLPVAAPDHDLWGDLAYWNGTGLPGGWSKVGSDFV